MNLICFDIDGTIETPEEDSEYVNGPIKLTIIDKLSRSDNIVVFVSPSPYAPKNDKGKEIYFRVSDYGSDTMRHKNLLTAKEMYPADLYLYVSNNGDYKEAQKAGFIYIDAQMFANGYGSNRG